MKSHRIINGIRYDFVCNVVTTLRGESGTAAKSAFLMMKNIE